MNDQAEILHLSQVHTLWFVCLNWSIIQDSDSLLVSYLLSNTFAILSAKTRFTDFWYSLNYNGQSYQTFQVAKWWHQDIYCLLNTFMNNFQVIGACNWRYKNHWNGKLSTEWENKCKQRNVDSWVECENAFLGGNGMLHLPRGIQTVFKLHYWTKILMK